jgi:acyl carrier protein
VVERIATYLRQNSRLDFDSLPAEAWPLEGLDSLEMLDLITFLESSFSIKVRDRDVRPENFGSIGSLAALVKQRQGTVE